MRGGGVRLHRRWQGDTALERSRGALAEHDLATFTRRRVEQPASQSGYQEFVAFYGDLEVRLVDAGHLEVGLEGPAEIVHIGAHAQRSRGDVSVQQRIDALPDRQQLLDVISGAVLLDLHSRSLAPPFERSVSLESCSRPPRNTVLDVAPCSLHPR